jgi:perosamine synthetase
MYKKKADENWKVPLFKIYWDDEDVERVKEVLTSGSYWATGKEIPEFEKQLSRYIDVEYCVVFNSGTSALHAVSKACGIKRGDEVIVPSFTFIATANAPLFVGAKPVFADIERETYGLDPEDVEKKISPRTKAIIPIHYGGCPCRIQELKQIAHDHGLLLIEDAAESLGARSDDGKVGTFGDAAVLSFCQNKVITTGEGGAVVTNSKEVYEKLKMIRSHGMNQTLNYFSSTESMEYLSLGYNLRMSTMTAALGISQLKKIDRLIEMRRSNASYLTQKLLHVEGIMTPSAPMGFYHVYQLYTVRVRQGLRDGLMKWLAQKGIMTKVYFPPVHQTHFYRVSLKYRCSLPVTEEMSQQVLSLPLYPTLSREEMDHIADEVGYFFKEAKS